MNNMLGRNIFTVIDENDEVLCAFDNESACIEYCQTHDLKWEVTYLWFKKGGDLEVMKKKADKWDALGKSIAKCYCNADGEYDEENPENSDADLCTIGEIAAAAFGWI